MKILMAEKSNIVTFKNGTVQVAIRKSVKARHVRLAVAQDGAVTAVQPARLSLAHFLETIEKNIAWIEKKIRFFHLNPPKKPIVSIPRHTPKEYAQYRKQAKTLVHERLEYFNQFYGFTYHKVAIRDQKTRWGSCSSRGNLNFSYKVIFLSKEQQDYLIVHELCHLKEFNHSKRFWNLVAQQIPDYKQINTTLKHGSIM